MFDDAHGASTLPWSVSNYHIDITDSRVGEELQTTSSRERVPADLQHTFGKTSRFIQQVHAIFCRELVTKKQPNSLYWALLESGQLTMKQTSNGYSMGIASHALSKEPQGGSDTTGTHCKMKRYIRKGYQANPEGTHKLHEQVSCPDPLVT